MAEAIGHLQVGNVRREAEHQGGTIHVKPVATVDKWRAARSEEFVHIHFIADGVAAALCGQEKAVYGCLRRKASTEARISFACWLSSKLFTLRK